MIIDKHETISRLVTTEDIPVVVKEADKIAELLFKPMGMYKSFFAIAHPQIEKDHPLRFFVLSTIDVDIECDKIMVVINPIITKHTNGTVDSQEGCATFNKLPMVTVQRWNKCTAEYSLLLFDKNKKPFISKRITLNLTGKLARIFQHETDHLNAKYIY